MSRKRITPNVVQAAFDAVTPQQGSRGFLDRVGPKHALPAYETTRPLETLTRQVLLTHIDLDPNQPRTNMDQQELEDLAASIREVGLVQYVTLQKLSDSDRYRVIAGHRRVVAAKMAGLDAVPAVIRAQDYTEDKVRVEQLVENIQRADLAPLDAARALHTFMERQKLSQREAAKRLGKPVMYVNELLTILKIDEKLLPKCEGLPKSALVNVGRAATPAKQADLLKLARASDAPHAAVARARADERKPRDLKYPYRYPVEKLSATVTVTFDEEPRDVGRAVNQALTLVVERLAQEKRQGDKRPAKGGRRG